MKKRFRTMKKWTWLLAVIALFFGVFLATAGYQMKHSIRAASYDVIDDEGNPVEGTYVLRRATATFGLSDYASGDK